MEFIHCPACRYAFDATRWGACPQCARRLGASAPADPMTDVDAAIAQLGAALGRLDAAGLDDLATRLLKAEHADPWAALVAGAIAGAIASRRDPGPGLVPVVEPAPEPAPATARERVLLTLALALLARLATVTREAATRLARRRPM